MFYAPQQTVLKSPSPSTLGNLALFTSIGVGNSWCNHIKKKQKNITILVNVSRGHLENV